MLKFSFFFFFIFFFSMFFFSWIYNLIILLFCFFFYIFNMFSFGWLEFFEFYFLDSLSSSLILLSFWICFLMNLVSYNIFLNFKNSMMFSFIVLILMLILYFCFSLHNIFFFFIFFEFSLIPTLFIILGWGYQPERLQAGLYMLLYTITASLPLLIIILFFGMYFGSFFFFFSWMNFFLFLKSNFFFFFFFWFSFFAFLVKLPIFGFHLWLPKAHVEAPVSGSMILAGILLKLGGYGIFRFLILFEYFFFFFFEFLIIFVLWGSVITSLICIRQTDLKGLVAYSSIGHMGMMFSGMLSFSYIGFFGSLLMMIGHGLCSSCLFILASLGYDFFGSRSIYLVKGFLVFFPSLSFWWFLFISGNMSAPSSLNLVSELFLFMSILGLSKYFFFFLALLSFFCGVYSLYLFTSFNHGFFYESCKYFIYLKTNILFSFFFHFFPLFFSFLVLEVFFFF